MIPVEAADLVWPRERTFGRDSNMVETVLGEITLAEARVRHEAARARLREIEGRIKRGELVERAVVEHSWIAVAAVLRERMLLIPARMSDRLVGLDQHAIRELLHREVVDALGSLELPEIEKAGGSEDEEE
ncbi:MAG: hypothetical protein PVJ64_00210 [Gemmatimonadales bacterium]|jgi:phage terminase Nu1 subunit (DNA packaging protein)